MQTFGLNSSRNNCQYGAKCRNSNCQFIHPNRIRNSPHSPHTQHTQYVQHKRHTQQGQHKIGQFNNPQHHQLSKEENKNENINEDMNENENMNENINENTEKQHKTLKLQNNIRILKPPHKLRQLSGTSPTYPIVPTELTALTTSATSATTSITSSTSTTTITSTTAPTIPTSQISTLYDTKHLNLNLNLNTEKYSQTTQKFLTPHKFKNKMTKCAFIFKGVPGIKLQELYDLIVAHITDSVFLNLYGRTFKDILENVRYYVDKYSIIFVAAYNHTQNEIQFLSDILCSYKIVLVNFLNSNNKTFIKDLVKKGFKVEALICKQMEDFTDYQKITYPIVYLDFNESATNWYKKIGNGYNRVLVK